MPLLPSPASIPPEPDRSSSIFPIVVVDDDATDYLYVLLNPLLALLLSYLGFIVYCVFSCVLLCCGLLLAVLLSSIFSRFSAMTNHNRDSQNTESQHLIGTFILQGAKALVETPTGKVENILAALVNRVLLIFY